VLALTLLVLPVTLLVVALTHLALALTLLVLALTRLVLALTRLVLVLTRLVLVLTLLVLALIHLMLALTRLVLVLVRWLLALDSQTQQMVAKDGTPESTALPRQRAQWSQQSIAKASRWRELDRIWRADPVLLFLILICAPTQLHLTRIRLQLAIYFCLHRGKYLVKGCRIATPKFHLCESLNCQFHHRVNFPAGN
jgi:hypothetical protein